MGQNIPFWRKHKLCLYRQENGLYFPAAEVKAHFVVVTGLENGYLQISSWGKEYYISWQEFEKYVKKYSSFLVSNICLITEKKASERRKGKKTASPAEKEADYEQLFCNDVPDEIH